MGTTSIKLITSDGVELSWGSLEDGGVLVSSDTDVATVGVLIDEDGNITLPDGATVDGIDLSATVPHQGTATLDFGATPIDDGSVVVTGQSWVTASSLIDAWVMRSTTADNTADEHEALATFGQFIVTDLVVGVGFTIQCNLTLGLCTGTASINWQGV